MTNPTYEKPKIITVSQLNFYVKSLLENDFTLNSVIVTGEISNLTDHYRSGHIYFSLKDDKSVIRCVMFSGSARNLRFKPQEGMKVIAVGRVSLYEQTGAYQLYVEGMQPDGIGELTMAYEQLKKKLESKGLFSQEHKKPIPAFPRTVGVITSPTGAVIRDIQNVISRRYPNVEILLCPVLVQGDAAAPQLINAVNLFNEYDLADVIIIGRGGGSIEDLWAFNDENLAYSVYASNIPIISAVGHETDTTLCDFVSDLRAPTPSAAAELAVPNRLDLLENVQTLFRQGVTAVNTLFSLQENDMEKITSVVTAHSPLDELEKDTELLESYAIRAKSAAENKLQHAEASAKDLFTTVEALNPVAVLNRGFAYITKEDNNISSVKDVESGDLLDITLKDGKIAAQVQ